MMATITRYQIQNVKLRKTPPPKIPSGTTSGQNGGFSSKNEALSVAAARNRFESMQSSPRKTLTRRSSSQDGVKPSEENHMSVSSARDKFEQKQAPPWKKANGKQTRELESYVQTKDTSYKIEKDKNFSGEEPRRKKLPPPFRLGPAPQRKSKPENLKYLLRKYKDQIVLSNGTKTAVPTSTQEKVEEIYDDVQSFHQGNQGNQAEEFYEAV